MQHNMQQSVTDSACMTADMDLLDAALQRCIARHHTCSHPHICSVQVGQAGLKHKSPFRLVNRYQVSLAVNMQQSSSGDIDGHS